MKTFSKYPLSTFEFWQYLLSMGGGIPILLQKLLYILLHIIQGPYPTYVTSTSGKIIPVVQAKCYTKYLGHLTLNFDSHGELLQPVEAAGVSYARPYLLDGEVIPDPETLEMMKKYQEN